MDLFFGSTVTNVYNRELAMPSEETEVSFLQMCSLMTNVYNRELAMPSEETEVRIIPADVFTDLFSKDLSIISTAVSQKI